ncbi:hypothetical protein EJ06DRAFT_91098 [Trichodelitschia bisporula]|uniref:Uncharacterized protein n=1 Tax=Trichodelitschia bisporula TaxID=703511 RepID=A0A6G1HRT0_9PEZI|nr:hypothetical protein EJ06DRAFT_91098 [Trichodelitschia bisporula]
MRGTGRGASRTVALRKVRCTDRCTVNRQSRRTTLIKLDTEKETPLGEQSTTIQGQAFDAACSLSVLIELCCTRNHAPSASPHQPTPLRQVRSSLVNARPLDGTRPALLVTVHSAAAERLLKRLWGAPCRLGEAWKGDGRDGRRQKKYRKFSGGHVDDANRNQCQGATKKAYVAHKLLKLA